MSKEVKLPVLRARYKVRFNGLDLRHQWYTVQERTDDKVKLNGKWYDSIYFEFEEK